jgi:hypothetical protein
MSHGTPRPNHAMRLSKGESYRDYRRVVSVSQATAACS